MTADVCSGRSRPKLRGDQQPDRKSGDTPEYRYRRREFDRAHIVIGPAVDFLRWQQCRAVEIPVYDRKDRPQAGGGCQRRVEREGRIQRHRRREQAQKRGYCEGQHQTGFAVCHRFCGLRLGHARDSLLQMPVSIITASP
jgi:hypothetical protein